MASPLGEAVTEKSPFTVSNVGRGLDPSLLPYDCNNITGTL